MPLPPSSNIAACSYRFTCQRKQSYLCSNDPKTNEIKYALEVRKTFCEHFLTFYWKSSTDVWEYNSRYFKESKEKETASLEYPLTNISLNDTPFHPIWESFAYQVPEAEHGVKIINLTATGDSPAIYFLTEKLCSFLCLRT